MILIESKTLEIHVVSEGNTHEYWRKSHNRHKSQKFLISKGLPFISFYKNIPITIKLIRLSSRKLDEHDNLSFAFKYIVDAIASLIYPGQQAGRADDTDLIKWKYGQEKGKDGFKGIRIEIYDQDNEEEKEFKSLES